MRWQLSVGIPKFTSIQKILILYGTGKQYELGLWQENLTTKEKGLGIRIKDLDQRNTWFNCHATLRQILGNWLGKNPSEIELNKNNFGKLYVPNSNLYFNLSHTYSSFLLGFSFEGKIGVDLEFLSGREDLPSLIEYAFSPGETEFCQQGNCSENFLKIWTLKEAYLKAAGVGLVDRLKSVNVHGLVDNDILIKQFNHQTFTCPNGETASVVYRNKKDIDYIWLG